MLKLRRDILNHGPDAETWKDHDTEPYLLGFSYGHIRRRATGDGVEKHGRVSHHLANLSSFFFGFHGFEEDGIDADFNRLLESSDGFVETVGLASVRPCDDQYLGLQLISRRDCCSESAVICVSIDDDFPEEMSTSLFLNLFPIV